MLIVQVEKCTGCGKCLAVCYFNAITMDDNKAKIVEELCTQCEACITACDDKAITKKAVVREEFGEKPTTKARRDILIIAECGFDNGQISEATKEIISKAAEISAMKELKISGLIIGHNIKECATELFSYGVSTVYYADNEVLKNFDGRIYETIVEQVTKLANPDIILLPGSVRGCELGPRVAARLGAGYAANCIDMIYDEIEDTYMATREICEGILFSRVMIPKEHIKIFTFREGVFRKAKRGSPIDGKLIEIPVEIQPNVLYTEILEQKLHDKINIPLDEAEIIVCGGRGIGSNEGFKLLEQFAKHVNGVLCATKDAVDAGYVSKERLLNVTVMKRIAPRLFFAIAMSGKMDITPLLSNAKIVVAINKNPEATIFQHAHYGIVEDYKTVIETWLNVK